MSNQYPTGPHDPNQPFVPQPQHQAPKQKHTGRKVFLGIGAGVVVLIVAAALAPSDPAKEAADKLPNVVTTTSAPTAAPVPSPGITADPPPVTPTNKPSLAATQPPKTTAPPKVTEPSLTRSQEQAIGKAESYLDYSAFSHKGLIEQLEYEGFTKADATYAVGHIKVSWNEQAAKKAESYLEMTQFSRSGLIEQLEFEGFTHKQAVYGVTKAGL